MEKPTPKKLLRISNDFSLNLFCSSSVCELLMNCEEFLKKELFVMEKWFKRVEKGKSMKS